MVPTVLSGRPPLLSSPGIGIRIDGKSLAFCRKSDHLDGPELLFLGWPRATHCFERGRRQDKEDSQSCRTEIEGFVLLVTVTSTAASALQRVHLSIIVKNLMTMFLFQHRAFNNPAQRWKSILRGTTGQWVCVLIVRIGINARFRNPRRVSGTVRSIDK